MRTCTIILLLALIRIDCYSQPAWSWYNHFGGTKNEFTSAVKTDNNGNVFITGTFESPVLAFGTNVLHLRTGSKKDIFLSKLDGNGNVLWAKSIGASGPSTGCVNNYSYVTCMTIDNNTACYMAGMFECDSLTFSPTIHLVKTCKDGDADIFIAKYDLSGNILWAKRFGGTEWDKVSDICTDNAGNIIVTGTFWSPMIRFDTFVLHNTGGTNAFVVKLNSNGIVTWAKSSSGKLGNEGICIAIDNSNNIVIGGNFMSNILTFDTQSVTNAGSRDIFLAKFDQTGNVLWIRSAQGNNSDELYALKTDITGNISIAGRFVSEHLTFGSLPALTNAGAGYTYDVFVARYDLNGNAIWSKGFGGVEEENCLALTLDNSGNILVSGLFESDVLDFDSHLVTKTGTRNTFITKLDQNANVLWAVSSAGNENDDIQCLTSENNGNIYILGSFPQAFSFGSCNISSNGLSDIYLIKFQ